MYKLLLGAVMCSSLAAAKFELTSSAFKNGEPMGIIYSCEQKIGGNKVPELKWSGAPEGTKTFALICDDPDAPMGTWVHWVIFNIPGSKTGLKIDAEIQHKEELPDGSKQGINDGKHIGYDGPCPPSGTHRYFFKLYALDTELSLPTRVTKDKLLAAMKGHIKGEAVLMGTYKKKNAKK